MTQVDNLLINFITEALMLFSLVDQSAFKQFVSGLQPNRSVMCRATLVQRISDKAGQVKKNIRAEMSKVEHVATATDCWSAHGHSFIGVTGQWIETETLLRKSCVLACHCLTGRLTNLMFLHLN